LSVGGHGNAAIPFLGDKLLHVVSANLWRQLSDYSNDAVALPNIVETDLDEVAGGQVAKHNIVLASILVNSNDMVCAVKESVVCKEQASKKPTRCVFVAAMVLLGSLPRLGDGDMLTLQGSIQSVRLVCGCVIRNRRAVVRSC
jgi:hypothetical protein